MKAREAVAQIQRANTLRLNAQDKVLETVREDQVAIHTRLSKAEKLALEHHRIQMNILGALAIEQSEFRHALLRGGVMSPEASARCDEAWEGVETPWKTATELERAQTETPAQQRETVRERPLLPHEKSRID
jgi:hypothetical protein